MNTNEEFEKPKKKNFLKSVLSFLKSHKWLVIVAVSIVVVVAIAITVVTMLHSAQAKKIAQAQIGKCYIETDSLDSKTITQIHYFTDSGVADLYVSHYENKYGDKYVSFANGSLNKADRNYTFRISLFGELTLSYSSSVKLNENNEIIELYGRPWKLISLEEALAFEEESYKLYAQNECEHEYGPEEVIEEATCTSLGESKQTCQKCGYVEVRGILQSAHDYVDKVCSVCGEKKQPEKSNVEADTWYTYQDIVDFQNIKLHYAFTVSQGKGMSVSYYFVCRHCHVVDESLRTSVPEFNYDINKMFTCDECGGVTTVRIKMR